VTRATVAGVLVDVLARAGARRLFAARAAGPLASLAREAGVDVVPIGDPGAAGLMAAVSGVLDDGPGVAVLDDGGEAAAAVAHATATGVALVLVHMGPVRPMDGASLKAVAGLEPASAAHWAAHAVRRALAPPRGPVVIDMPPEVADRPAVPVATAVRPTLPPPDPAALDAAGALLAAAARPVLVAGGQCRFGHVAAWLRPFAEALPAPVLATPLGKGTLADPHPLALGLLGGGPVPRALLEQADLVVGVGLMAGEITAEPWSAGARTLHIGPTAADPAAWRPTAQVVGEPALVLEELAPRLRGITRADWDVAALDRLKRVIRVVPGGRLELRTVVAVVREALPAGAIATVDPGLALQDITAAWESVAPGDLLLPLGVTARSFALPAARAAALARPGHPVVAFTCQAANGTGEEDRAIVVVASAPPGEGGGPGSVRAGDAAALRTAIARRLAGHGPALVVVGRDGS
jgi:acetolactate synthase-1/2/3 large subunit